MWHESHNMFQNKIWGGKIATKNAESATPQSGGLPTPRMSVGLAGPRQGGPARAVATGDQPLPRVPAGTPYVCPWLPKGNQPIGQGYWFYF
jgi:hypothetical protein